ncbi:hypothetical protein [Microbacterium sp. NIBRBAC000506063]|nr:hypothetical protein [Microbacterium sp. NIBRBAC000506063]
MNGVPHNRRRPRHDRLRDWAALIITGTAAATTISVFIVGMVLVP